MELAILLNNFRIHYCECNELKWYFLNLEAFEDDPVLYNHLCDLGYDMLFIYKLCS